MRLCTWFSCPPRKLISMLCINKFLSPTQSFFQFILFYLFIFRERKREGERKGEKQQCVVASWVPPTGDLARTPGMCPDWESSWQPFEAGTQSTEPHQPAQPCSFFMEATGDTFRDAVPTWHHRDFVPRCSLPLLFCQHWRHGNDVNKSYSPLTTYYLLPNQGFQI